MSAYISYLLWNGQMGFCSEWMSLHSSLVVVTCSCWCSWKVLNVEDTNDIFVVVWDITEHTTWGRVSSVNKKTLSCQLAMIFQVTEVRQSLLLNTLWRVMKRVRSNNMCVSTLVDAHKAHPYCCSQMTVHVKLKHRLDKTWLPVRNTQFAFFERLQSFSI